MLFDEIQATVQAKQPVYPPEQSQAGTNSYSIQCGVVGWKPGYCVCLAKIGAFERDRSLKSYPECERGIRNKECPALELREKERVAQRALFYVDRTLLREETDRRLNEIESRHVPSRPKPKSVWSAAVTTATTPVKPTPARTQPAAPKVPVVNPASIIPSSVEDGYAAAINAAIQEASKPIAPVTSTPRKAPSLLELARIQMGKQKGAEV